MRIYRLPKGRDTGSVFRTMTQGQSIYPDITLYISNYCVYCIEDHNINAHICFCACSFNPVLGFPKCYQLFFITKFGLTTVNV